MEISGKVKAGKPRSTADGRGRPPKPGPTTHPGGNAAPNITKNMTFELTEKNGFNPKGGSISSPRGLVIPWPGRTTGPATPNPDSTANPKQGQ
jgi:hypothetical protein